MKRQTVGHPTPQDQTSHAPVSVDIAHRLLGWYDRNRRSLPWRALPGIAADPYRVWLSEIMLQQTVAAGVGRYFERFLHRWPSLAALASAPLEEVLHEWAGLGYYARARNLHACAKVLVNQHGGQFPRSPDALISLPGIGPYTAAAIAAIAFGQPATAVDGNVERVVARLFAVTTPLTKAKPLIRNLAGRLVPNQRPGDYTQAMMDLGAAVCTARQPNCSACPLPPDCQAHAQGISDHLPTRTPRAARPLRHGTALWLESERGILLRRRPHHGLLGGMMEVPSTTWQEGTTQNGHKNDSHKNVGAVASALGLPFDANWQMVPGVVRHMFTHFILELRVAAGQLPVSQSPDGIGYWCPLAMIGSAGLPSVMRKVADLVIQARQVAAL